MSAIVASGCAVMLADSPRASGQVGEIQTVRLVDDGSGVHAVVTGQFQPHVVRARGGRIVDDLPVVVSDGKVLALGGVKMAFDGENVPQMTGWVVGGCSVVLPVSRDGGSRLVTFGMRVRSVAVERGALPEQGSRCPAW